MTLKDVLTQHQFRIAGLVKQGMDDRQIARKNNRAYDTVKKTVSTICYRAGTRRRLDLAVRYAVEEERGLYTSVQENTR